MDFLLRRAPRDVLRSFCLLSLIPAVFRLQRMDDVELPRCWTRKRVHARAI